MRKPKYLLALALMGAFALTASSAFAGSVTTNDDPTNNPPEFQTGLKPNCDTIDPVLTVNNSIVKYKCISFPGAPGMPAENGVANLTSAKFETSSTGCFTYPFGSGTATQTTCIPAAAGYTQNAIHMQWTTEGPIPTPGADTLFEGVNGFSFTFYFQNRVKQNARQIIGNTIDCQRYAHMGPYLTGHGEYYNIHYELAFEEGTWHENVLFAHLDPVAYNNWAFLADKPQSGTVRGCDGNNLPTQLGNSPGTRAISVVDQARKTVHLIMPMHWHYVDNQFVPYTYKIMDPGDLITSISANVSAVVDTATTPKIDVGPIQQSQQGVSNTFLLDWIPAASYNLGTVPAQTRAIYGPTCAGFDALEYTPGGAKNNTGGTYAPLTKGPAGQDRDTQVNPLFGLDNYDSSKASGTTTNDLRPQSHNGAETCNIVITTSPYFTGSGATITA